MLFCDIFVVVFEWASERIQYSIEKHTHEDQQNRNYCHTCLSYGKYTLVKCLKNLWKCSTLSYPFKNVFVASKIYWFKYFKKLALVLSPANSCFR